MLLSYAALVIHLKEGNYSVKSIASRRLVPFKNS